MKKLDSKGFTLVEGLLILVIVAILGGTGYYVYSQQNKSNEVDSVAQEKVEENNSESQEDSNVPDGWVKYTNEEFGFTLNAPDSFNIDNPNYEDFGDSENESGSKGKTVEISSDDITIKAASSDFARSGVGLQPASAGAVKGYYNKNGVTYLKVFDEKLDSAEQFGSNGVYGIGEHSVATTPPIYEYMYIFNLKDGGLVIATTDKSKQDVIKSIAESVTVND